VSEVRVTSTVASMTTHCPAARQPGSPDRVDPRRDANGGDGGGDRPAGGGCADLGVHIEGPVDIGGRRKVSAT
jgi:hypothetical protein